MTDHDVADAQSTIAFSAASDVVSTRLNSRAVEDRNQGVVKQATFTIPTKSSADICLIITGCVVAGLSFLALLPQIAAEIVELIQNPVAWVEARVAEIQQVIDDLMTDASQTVKSAIKAAIGYDQMRIDPWGWAGNIGCSLIIDAMLGTLAAKIFDKVYTLIRDRDPDVDLNVPIRCSVLNSFPTGTPVLMGGGSYRAIDRITPGEPPLSGSGVTVAIRTAQPFDSIRSVLESRDYNDRGDGIYITDRRPPDSIYTAIGFVDNLVVGGSQPDEVLARIEDPLDGREDLLVLLDQLSEPIKVARVSDTGECGKAIAAGTEAPATAGTWIIRVGADSDVDRLLLEPGDTFLDGLGFELRSTAVTLEGDFVRVGSELRGNRFVGPSAISTLVVFGQRYVTAPVYACP